MSRREKRTFAVFLILVAAVPSGVMVGLRLLGARDELTAVMVVVAFVLTMLACSFLFDDLLDGKH